MIASFVLVMASAPTLTTLGEGTEPPERLLLALAEQSFREGISLRGDSSRARPMFARAAIAFDELWQRGCHQPELALNRAHAHQLADDLPRAIAALREGLQEAPWSRPLQVALEEARSAVAYPASGELAEQCRPKAVVRISNRVPPPEAAAIVGLLWFVVCAGIARLAMTRARRWLVISGLALVVTGALGGLWLNELGQRQEEASVPLVIVSAETILRKGNGEAYEPRLAIRLPRGIEARELHRRGGWVQVRLAGGIIGWLPEEATIRAGLG